MRVIFRIFESNTFYMIQFDKFVLNNGLKVLVHTDKSSPMVAMNILYNVGSRDEDPNRTGFAHLFEHLMFGGSVNIPSYDEPLDKAGGENNAFTSNDITNYYLSIPKNNMETAFWLESDRMLNLAFTPKSLEVQRDVVIEEFKQNYLNQPYGDLWLKMRPLIYKTHPYQWATIGKDVKQIQTATMDEVKAFYTKFYTPNNAIMVLSGNIELEEAKVYSEKWFGPIPSGNAYTRSLPKEPKQTEARKLVLEQDVPANALFIAYPMCNRLSNDYHATDLISDVLSNGKSGRFYQHFVKKHKLFSNISAFISGDADEGLFFIGGYLQDGVEMEVAEQHIKEQLDIFITEGVKDSEFRKVKNKIQAATMESQVSILEKAMNLAYYEWLGDAQLLNDELAVYENVNKDQLQAIAKELFKEQNSNTLFYKKTTPSDNQKD